MTATDKYAKAPAKPPVVREYDIGGKKYIVSATTKAGATESAAAKVRRLIRNEIKGNVGE